MGEIYWRLHRMYVAGEKLDQNIVSRILHCVVSYEKSSVIPKSLEAVILSDMIETVLKVFNVSSLIENDQNEDEFTAYDGYSETVYLKRI